MTTRDEIEAGADLTDAEIEAVKNNLRRMQQDRGTLSGCVSFCQRHMDVGWSHALRIVELLEAEGFVTEPNSAGLRKRGPNWTW